MKRSLVLILTFCAVVGGCTSIPIPSPSQNPPLIQTPQTHEQVQLTGALYTTIPLAVVGIGVGAVLIYLTFAKLGVGIIIGCIAEIAAALAVVEELKYAKWIAITVNAGVCVLIVGSLVYAGYWIVETIKAHVTDNTANLSHPIISAISNRLLIRAAKS